MNVHDRKASGTTTAKLAATIIGSGKPAVATASWTG